MEIEGDSGKVNWRLKRLWESKMEMEGDSGNVNWRLKGIIGK